MSSVISKVEKEFIFKFLTQNRVKLEIKYEEFSLDAYILEFNSKEIKIELLIVPDDFKKYFNIDITVFFYFQNNYHTFNSNIRKIQGNMAIIKNPESIAKNLQRKFERIHINGQLFANFSIRGELLRLNFPISKASYYPSRPPIDADFFGLTIKKILKKFNDKMKDIVSIYKIKMLRNYTPGSFEESLVLKFGKIIYIPNIYADIPQSQPSSNYQVLLKTDWINHEIQKNKTPAYSVNNILSKYLLNLSKNGVFSEVIIPVLYRNYVVALIYLFNNLQKSQPISIKVLSYAYQFSLVLSYTLKENGYFKDEEGNTQNYILPIQDMSPGGLALEHPDDFFEDKLLLNHNFQILIQIEDKPVRVLAKLVRKFQKITRFCYGFMFIDIKKQDYEFLYDYLYRNKLKEVN